MVRCIIIDDEEFGRRNLELLITKYCENIVIQGIYESTLDAVKDIQEFNPDVVFLDISMPLQNGFDFLENLPFERQFEVVFVTAFEDFGIQAIKAGALDYITKPIVISELQVAIEKAAKKKQKQVSSNALNKISISHSKGISLIDPLEIIYLKGDDNITTIFLTNDRKLSVSKTLKEFEKSLDVSIFIRIHKSFIVNLKFVESYSLQDGGCVKLASSGLILPISRRKLSEFLGRVHTSTSTL